MTNFNRVKDVGCVFAVWLFIAFLTYFLPATVGVFVELSWSHYNPANWNPNSREILGALVAIEFAIAILLAAVVDRGADHD